MKIREDQLWHGAALNQIAEHPQFTAINSLKVKGKVSRSAYKINHTIAVYLKYATAAKGTFCEYQFTFSEENLTELEDIAEIGDDVFVALVYGQDCEICCVPYATLRNLIRQRRRAAGYDEEQYAVLVTLKPKEAFRVYMNQPGKKKTYLSTPKKVARNRFPNDLFKNA